jgi:hypothetical protein
MSTAPGDAEDDGRSVPRRVVLALVVGGALTLLLHAAAPLVAEPDLWGVGTWRGVPAGWRTFLLVTGLFLLVGGRRVDAWFASPLRSPWTPWLAGALFCVAFLALSSEVPWANARIASKAAGRGEVTLKHIYASAAAALFARGASAVSGLYHGDTGYALVSALSGALFVPGAFALGHALFPRSRERARAAALVLCTAGWSQMFFGVVETYTAAMPAQVWTLAWMVRLYRAGPRAPDDPDATDERGRAGLMALLCFSLGVGIFAAVAVLGPALLLVLLLRRPARIDLAYVVVPALPLVGAAILFLAYGRDPESALAHMGGSDGRTWVPLSEAGAGRNFHFEMLSLGHLDARLEVLSLCAPVWLPLLLLGLVGGARERIDRLLGALLGVAAVASASYAIGVNPDMGPPMEWMQSACGIVAPYVLVVWLGLARAPRRAAGRIGTALVALSVAHTLPWVLVNAGVLS